MKTKNAKHLKAKKSDEQKLDEDLQLILDSSPVHKMLPKMKFRDLQRACIVRGMKFEEMVKSDIIGLHNFLLHEWDKPKDMEKLNAYDEWKKEWIEKKYGKDEPFIRLGFMGKKDEEGKPSILKITKEKPIKPKRERDETMGSIYKGTKKALTYQSIKEGKTIDETIAIVTEAFPEAVDKSIRLWSKKCSKAFNIEIGFASKPGKVSPAKTQKKIIKKAVIKKVVKKKSKK